ncbi:MAG: hypothetical protein ACRDP3_25025, partial [Streptomyces sp.]
MDTARDGSTTGGSGDGGAGGTGRPGQPGHPGQLTDEALIPHPSPPAETPSSSRHSSHSSHSSRCTCGDCPHGVREGHRHALSTFRSRRDELAEGGGLPAALAHSPGASRQWVSDELTRAARTVADRGREEGAFRMAAMWRRTLITV